MLSLVSAQCPAILKGDVEGAPLHSPCVAAVYFFTAVHKFFIQGDSSYTNWVTSINKSAGLIFPLLKGC